MSFKKCVSLAIVGLFFASCSKTPQVPRRQGTGETGQGLFGILSDPGTLKVVDLKGKEIPTAQVLIGTAVDAPFEGNLMPVNSDGTFAAPAAWTTEESVTISAPGYVRATYLGQTPHGQSFTLRPILPQTPISLTGETTGFKVKDYDKIVDFGLVIPAITKQTFFNFDVSTFISKDTEEISIIGNKINIPKNVTLPKQKESYFLPFELNKPKYQLDFRNAGERMIYVARGQFPLDEVIGDIRNDKEFYELAKYFSIKGGTLKLMDLQVSSTQDLNVTDLNYNASRQVMGPASAKDEVVLSVPLAMWKGWYYPTDIKMLAPGKAQKMTTAAGGVPHLLSILKRKDELNTKTGNMDRLSANFIPFDEGTTPSFLSLMDQPTVVSPYHLQTKATTKPDAVIVGTQYAVLSQVTEVGAGGTKIDVLENLWEVYAPDWAEDFSIPEWPGEKALSGRLRWEVTRTGVLDENLIKNVDLGPQWLEAATHATRSSKDF